MRTFAVTSTNDLLFSGGYMVVSTGINAVLQVCEQCAKAILGEMVFAQEQGMPYFETVWIGHPTTAPFEAAFRDRIPQIEGVTGIDELTVTVANGKMAYTATIATVYGTGTVNG